MTRKRSAAALERSARVDAALERVHYKEGQKRARRPIKTLEMVVFPPKNRGKWKETLPALDAFSTLDGFGVGKVTHVKGEPGRVRLRFKRPITMGALHDLLDGASFKSMDLDGGRLHLGVYARTPESGDTYVPLGPALADPEAARIIAADDVARGLASYGDARGVESPDDEDDEEWEAETTLDAPKPRKRKTAKKAKKRKARK